MVEIDSNLVLSIWTGSIVPLAGVILYYWLFRRFELRRAKHQRKRAAYKQFLRAIPTTVEGLVDYQYLSRIKQPDPADPNAATTFYTQVTTLTSVLKSKRAIDIVKDSMSAKPLVDGKQLTREQVLDMVRAGLLLEIGHIVISGIDQVDRCVEDIEEFDLPESVDDALGEVMQLYGERAAKMYAALIGEAFGMPTGDDTMSWMRDWDKALENLKSEIEADLESM